MQAGRAVRFAYRKPSGEESDREVEPWGVVSWRGRWYLVGHDRDRDAPRCFRLSRVLGAVRPVGPDGAVKVPTGIDLVGYVVATEPPEFHRFARVRVRRGQGIWLRKIAARIEPGERGSDWDVAEIGYDDPEWIADRVARQGSGGGRGRAGRGPRGGRPPAARPRRAARPTPARRGAAAGGAGRTVRAAREPGGVAGGRAGAGGRRADRPPVAEGRR